MIKRFAFFIFLLVFLLPPVACNYPGVAIRGTDVPVSDLRQTLEALISPTPPVPPAGTDEIFPTPNTLDKPTPNPNPPATASFTPSPGGDGYVVHPGDTLASLALRFDVDADQISLPPGISAEGFLPAGTVLNIPLTLEDTFSPDPILPDAEVVYSPTSSNFDIADYVRSAGGYLATYSEEHDGETLSGVDIVEQIAQQSSINPRLLLGFLEYRSGWVLGQPADPDRIRNPIGFYVPGHSGLYEELSMAATQINLGYYGWRQGNRVTIKFADGQTARLHPALNPGSAAVENLFSKFYNSERLLPTLFDPDGFLALYSKMFGDPWERADNLGPLIPDGLAQPILELPFLPGERWSLTAGPHPAWDSGSPRAALDFSPTTGGAACAVSSAWATASAPGIVVRADRNTVVLDLDGDGYEGTGWVLVYFHVADDERIRAGTSVEQDDPLGHPSCEGGRATGKHIHISRKYNGEWMAADGPLPFVLSGWRAVADLRNYQGSLVKGDQIVSSNSGGIRTSIIERH